MLFDSESIWNGYLRRISIAKHRIKLSLADAMAVLSALFRAGSEAREPEKNETDKCCLKYLSSGLKPHENNQ